MSNSDSTYSGKWSSAVALSTDAGNAAVEIVQSIAGSQVAERVRLKHYSKGSQVYVRGDQVESVFFLLSGKVRIYSVGNNGRRVTHWFVSGGEFFGLADHWNRSRAHDVCAESQQSVVVLVIPHKDLGGLMDSYPLIRDSILRQLARRVRTNRNLIVSSTTEQLSVRLFELLVSLEETKRFGVQEKRAVIGYTQEDLAELLGVTRQSVNRVLRHFESKGLIKVQRRRISVVKGVGSGTTTIPTE